MAYPEIFIYLCGLGSGYCLVSILIHLKITRIFEDIMSAKEAARQELTQLRLEIEILKQSAQNKLHVIE